MGPKSPAASQSVVGFPLGGPRGTRNLPPGRNQALLNAESSATTRSGPRRDNFRHAQTLMGGHHLGRRAVSRCPRIYCKLDLRQWIGRSRILQSAASILNRDAGAKTAARPQALQRFARTLRLDMPRSAEGALVGRRSPSTVLRAGVVKLEAVRLTLTSFANPLAPPSRIGAFS